MEERLAAIEKRLEEIANRRRIEHGVAVIDAANMKVRPYPTAGVVFDRPFPSVPVVMAVGGTAGSVSPYVVDVFNVNRKGFTIKLTRGDNPGNGTNSDRKIRWVAFVPSKGE